MMSASIMGREWGGEERMDETVDLPVAIEPVRPRRSILTLRGRRRMEGEMSDGCCGVLVLTKLGGKWSDAGSLSCEDAELRRLL